MRATCSVRRFTMTRSDLVEELAARFGQLTQRDAEFAVKAILDAMNDALVRGHRIEIRGFGSFSVNRRPPRMGRNPRSGESVQIPEKRVPHFKPGKELRERVNALDEATLVHLMKVKFPSIQNNYANYQPVFLIDQMIAICEFEGIPLQMTPDLIDRAWSNMFVRDEKIAK